MGRLRDKAPASSAPVGNFRTSTSSTAASVLSVVPSEVPSIDHSSSAASIATLSSLPSITSTETVSTITPSIAVQNSTKRKHVMSPSGRGGRSGGTPAAALTAGGSSQSRKGNSREPVSLQEQQQGVPRMELPVLPALEDTGFDLLPLLLTDTGSFDTTSFFKPTATDHRMAPSSSTTITSTLTPSSTAHFLTSRSSQIEGLHQPYQPYLSTAAAPAMVTKTATAIDSGGNVIHHDSVNLLSSAVPGYFIHNQSPENNRGKEHHRPRPRPALGPRTFTSTSTSLESHLPVPSTSAVPQSRPTGHDDLSAPRRFVIRKPSASHLPTAGSVGSTLSRPPSLSRSLVSEEGTSLYSQSRQSSVQQQQPLLDTPNSSPSNSNPNAAASAAVHRKEHPAKATQEVTFIVPPKSTATTPGADPKSSGLPSRKDSKRERSTGTNTNKGATGGEARPRKLETPASRAPSSLPRPDPSPLLAPPSTSPSSLRTRLSRLFRPHTKGDKNEPQRSTLDLHSPQQRQGKAKAPTSPQQVNSGPLPKTPVSASGLAGVGVTNGAQTVKSISAPEAADITPRQTSRIPRQSQPRQLPPPAQQQKQLPPPSSLSRASGLATPRDKLHQADQRQQPLSQQRLSSTSGSEQRTSSKPLKAESSHQTQEQSQPQQAARPSFPPNSPREKAELGTDSNRDTRTQTVGLVATAPPLTATVHNTGKTTRKVSSIPRPAPSTGPQSEAETVSTPPSAPAPVPAQLPIVLSKEPESTESIVSTSIRPPSFAPGEDISVETPIQSVSASPNRSDRSTPRHRRVSSVSSSNSIRQVGTYGGMGTLASPARKANPYHTGALARFSPGMTNATILGSPKRKSSSSPVDKTMIALQQAAANAPPVPSLPLQSTTPPPVALSAPVPKPSPLSTSPSVLNMALQRLQQEQHDQPQSMSQPVATFMFDEEYSIEKDSVHSSVQNTPTLARPHQSYASRITATPSPQPRVLLPSTSGELRVLESDDLATPRSSAIYPAAPQATPEVSEGLFADEEFARRNEGVVITEYASDEHEDDDDDDDDDEEEEDDDDESVTETEEGSKGPRESVDTLRTSDTGSHTQDMGSTTDFSAQQRRPSYVSAVPSKFSTRRSMEPPESSTPRPRLTVHPPAMLSRQWSESSYDPCAPMRWDELLEMDPNSKGPLWLSNRGLGQISNEFFDGLRNLRELYLDHNDIKMVPDSLLKLTKLDVLDLSWNSLSSFHSAFKFKKLKKLRRLNLDHNLLTDISPLYKLKSLRELRLNHNLVQYLAMSIQHLTKLKILAVESNQIATLPDTMGRLYNLCELRLSDNNLRVLPESIGSLRTLQVLALRSNLLEKLPESWKEMESLTTLDLACNRLTSLPSDLVRLPKLTHLDLHDNQLQVLPEKIGTLGNLLVLQLCNNHLRELPRDIGRLRDIQDLVLSFNRLERLPDEIGKLTKLQELKWNNNPLCELPKTVQKLSQVRRIHLQGCRLQQLPVALGVVFKDLIYLDISDNQFEVLPALDQMHRLEELYISHNLIRDLGTSALYLAGTTSGGSGTVSAITGAAAAAAAVGSATSSGVAAGSSLVNASVQSSASNTLTSTGTSSMSMSTAVNDTTNPEGSLSISTGPASGTGLIGMLAANAAASSSIGASSANHQRSSIGAGVTASKLADLKRLRVLEAHHNQIRVVTNKIKLLRGLEVLDLGHNLLDGIPREVGDLSLLKVLVLEGNPIQSLPSTLSKLMGSLEIFQIGEWPEHGFEITRDQAPINMKISILQSAMPRQIERTLLWRMHEAILKRAHELDSQKDPYPNGYENRISTERFRHRNTGLSPTALTGTTTLALASSTVYSLQRQLQGEGEDEMDSSSGGARTTGGSKMPKSSSLPLQVVPKKSHHMGIAQGLAIATKHIMQGRGFGLPAMSDASQDSPDLRRADDDQSLGSSSLYHTGSSSPTISAFSTDSRVSLASTSRQHQDSLGRRHSKESNSEYDIEVAMVNMDGIHPNEPCHPPPLTRLQIATPPSILGHRSGGPEVLSMSPLSELAPSPRLSAPNNPILRARRSAQQLGGTRGRGATGKKARPTSMYTSVAGPTNDEEELRLQKPVIGYALQHHKASMSNTDLSLRPLSGAGQHPLQGTSSRPRTAYENHNLSSLYLNSDAMAGLGIGTEPGTAGSVITHSNGPFTTGRLEVPGLVQGHRSGTRGSGDLSDLKSSLAIKSSPALSSQPLPSLGSSSSSPLTGYAPNRTTNASAAHSNMGASMPRSQTPNPTSSAMMDMGSSAVLSRNNTGTGNTSPAGPLSRLGVATRNAMTPKAFNRPSSPSPTTQPRAVGLLRTTSASDATTAGSTARPEAQSTLPWLRLKTSASGPSASSPVDSSSSSPLLEPPNKPNTLTLKRGNSSSVKISASAILSGLTSSATSSTGAVNSSNGGSGGSGSALAGLNVTTPPPIFLDYELGTSSSLDLPSQFYYHPGEPVEGDVDLDPSTVSPARRRYDRVADENEDEGEDVEELLAEEGYGVNQPSLRSLATPMTATTTAENALIDNEYTMPSGPDPVLKIAILKGVYDQILYNFENAHQRRMGSQDTYWSSEDGHLGGHPGHPTHRGSKKGSERFKLFRFLNPLSASNQAQQHPTTSSSVSHRGTKDYSSLSEQHHSLFQHPAQHFSNVVHTT